MPMLRIGVASNSLTNDGTIDVHASATANAASQTFATENATVTANANAYVSYGISQSAQGGTSATNDSNTLKVAVTLLAQLRIVGSPCRPTRRPSAWRSRGD